MAPTIPRMLSEAQKQELDAVLKEAERRVLLTAQQTLAQSLEGTRDEGRDSIDMSNAEARVSTTLRLRDREQKLLSKIREAMKRLDDGSIEECEECGGEIAFKRLLARPVTTLCIDCKESAEEEERRTVRSEESPEQWPRE